MKQKFMIHEATFNFEMGRNVPNVDDVDWSFVAEYGIKLFDEKDRSAIKAMIDKSISHKSLIDALTEFYSDKAMSIFDELKSYKRGDKLWLHSKND